MYDKFYQNICFPFMKDFYGKERRPPSQGSFRVQWLTREELQRRQWSL